MPEPDDTNTPPTGDQPGDKTFTQADVDRIIAERIARAKSAPPADYDDLKKAAAELADLKAAQLSDQEKLAKRAEEAEAKAAAAEARANAAALRSAIVAEASRAGAVDPDAVAALLDKSAVTVGDDGQVTGVAEAVASLLATKQYLVGKPTSPGSGGGSGDQGARGKPGQITREQLKTMSPEAIDEAFLRGDLAHLTTPT